MARWAVNDFKVGEKYHIYRCPHRYKIHILAIIEGMVAYKYYGKYKQWWHYVIEHPETLDIHVERCKKISNKEK